MEVVKSAQNSYDRGDQPVPAENPVPKSLGELKGEDRRLAKEILAATYEGLRSAEIQRLQENIAERNAKAQVRDARIAELQAKIAAKKKAQPTENKN